MYSAEISRQTLLHCGKIRKHFPKLARALDKASRQMLELEEDLKASQNPYQVLSNPGVLPVTFLTISGELEEILEEKIWKRSFERRSWNFILLCVIF